jgi:hypothetical protein
MGANACNFGSLYVNNLNQFGRSWQVNMQGRAAMRQKFAGLSPSLCLFRLLNNGSDSYKLVIFDNLAEQHK